MKKIILVVFSLNLFFANAQVGITNNGNMQIHTGGILTGFADFTNTASATLINNGSLYLKGNTTNAEPGMNAGIGTLYLNGSSAQSINGTQIFKTNNLVNNNNTGITLNANLSVSGMHTFTSGMISTSVTPNYLVYEDGASHTGSSDNSHVNGWVKKIGNTNFSFPVGNGTYLRSVAVEDLSAYSEFNARYSAPTPGINRLISPIKLIKANEYWQINRLSGGTARVGLNWNHNKVPMDHVVIDDISVVNYTGGNWNAIGGTASGNVATTGIISSDIVNAFGSFTLGYETFPVPLKLISFSGERRTSVSYLTWITADEQNVDRFEVQRSYNGTDFVTIGQLAARNLSSLQYYSFNDASASGPVVYYRLRCVDVDDKFSFSQVIIFSGKSSDMTGFIVTNPARQFITVFNKTGHAGLIGYNLITSSGQLILQGNIYMNLNTGAVIELPGHIAGGIYVLNLRKGTMLFTQKIVVEK